MGRNTQRPTYDRVAKAVTYRSDKTPSHRRGAWVPAGVAPPTVPAVPTAFEAHERVGGHADTRQLVLVRAVIASYTHTNQLAIPILPLISPGQSDAIF